MQTLNDDSSDEDAFTVQPSTNKLNNVYSTTIVLQTQATMQNIIKFKVSLKIKKTDNSRFIKDGMSVENFVIGSSNSLQGIEKFRSNKSSIKSYYHPNIQRIQEENMMVRDSLLSSTSNGVDTRQHSKIFLVNCFKNKY